MVEVPRSPDRTQVISPLPEFARSGGGGLGAVLIGDNQEDLQLPADKQVVLEVVAGPSAGVSLILNKPRVIVGRTGADIDLADAGVSRWHCAVEVCGSAVRLRDLDSTNGTYYQEERVRAAELSHLSEFRLGTSLLRVRIEPKPAR